MLRRLAVVITVLLGTLLATACGPDSNIRVVNNTDQYLVLYAPMRDGKWQALADMPPHSQYEVNFIVSAGDYCLPDVFVADKNKNIVKRIDKLCWHDNVTVP